MSDVIKFLLVDDEPDILELGAEMLEMEDQIVSVAKDGQEAIDFIKSGKEIDVIISDYNMPVMGGLEFLEKLIEHKGEERPLFFFSTGAIDFTEEDAKTKGATGVIYKPFDFDEVLERVRKALADSK